MLPMPATDSPAPGRFAQRLLPQPLQQLAPPASLFWIFLVLVVLFELALVWLIMPLPGSQRMASLDWAYRAHEERWVVRRLLLPVLGAMAFYELRHPGGRRLRAAGGLAVAVAVGYATNFVMAADAMFKMPTVLSMRPAPENLVPLDRLVVGIEVNGEARAYPLMFIGYHHQVPDVVGGEPVLVTYCTVCRTGRVFSPVVDGVTESFRLVGMDHWNAMLEDATTKSWWRQANGEAVTGSRKGYVLREFTSLQVTLAEWLALHPASLVMQGDPDFTKEYAKDYAYEKGTSRKTLTGTDTTSWGEKSWVVGIIMDSRAVAFDWNRLKRERVINAMVGRAPIVLALASDTVSYYAYLRPDSALTFTLRNDTLVSERFSFPVNGGGSAPRPPRIVASQEFWHSWRTFQPGTARY